MKNDKVKALMIFLDIDEHAASALIDSGSCMVYTDDEAQKAAIEYVKETLWAFDSAYLLTYLKVQYNENTIKAFDKLKECCESSNEIIALMIKDVDAFAEEVISMDGRGNILASYDGNENIETIYGVDYYIYKN